MPKQGDLTKPSPRPTGAQGEALDTITVTPRAGSASSPASLLGAHVVGGQVYRFDLERVAVDDFEEVHECSAIALRAQLGLARLDRAGLHDDWRRKIHAAELERAVGRLVALNAFLPVPADDQSADEPRMEKA